MTCSPRLLCLPHAGVPESPSAPPTPPPHPPPFLQRVPDAGRGDEEDRAQGGQAVRGYRRRGARVHPHRGGLLGRGGGKRGEGGTGRRAAVLSRRAVLAVLRLRGEHVPAGVPAAPGAGHTLPGSREAQQPCRQLTAAPPRGPAPADPARVLQALLGAAHGTGPPQLPRACGDDSGDRQQGDAGTGGHGRHPAALCCLLRPLEEWASTGVHPTAILMPNLRGAAARLTSIVPPGTPRLLRGAP